MRASLLLAATMLLPSLSRGQQPVVFDTVRFNQVGSFAIGHAVFPIDSGYLCFSIQKGPPSLSQDIYATRFDSAGGVTWEKAFQTYQQDDIGQSSTMVRAAYGYYGASDRSGVLTYMDSLFVYRFGDNGDTLWTRFLDVDTTFLIHGIVVEQNSDVLLCGTRDPGRHPYIYHLDSLGNSKGYHPFNDFDGEDVVEGKDRKWYLGGRGNQLANYNHAVLLRSDTSGSVIWTRTLAPLSFYTSLIALHDHTVLGLGSIGYTVDTGGFALAIKYDTTGTQVWRKELFQTDDIDWPCQLNAGYENADSTLILAGWFRSIAERDKGMLVKLRSNGDVIWQHLYSHYPGTAYGKDQIFWDVKPTSDGGMVLTGETNSDGYPYAQLWLLKLDSMGCLVAGCGSVGVQEYMLGLEDALHLAPNPVSDVLNVSLSLPQELTVQGQLLLTVTDMQGRIVQQKKLLPLGEQRVAVDVSTFAHGSYALHVSDAQRLLVSKVFVKE